MLKKTKPVIKYRLIITSSPKTEQGKKISFDYFSPSDYNATFISNFKCHNGTNDRVYIEWENARLTGSRIIFGDDRRITMGQPKADEAFSGNSYSISRDIPVEVYVGSSYLGLLYHPKELKKNIGKKDTTYLTIPIRFSDGTIESSNWNILFGMKCLISKLI